MAPVAIKEYKDRLGQITAIVAGDALAIMTFAGDGRSEPAPTRIDGKYARPIRIIPLLSETRATIRLDEEQYNCSTYYSLPIRDDGLPALIEDKLVQYAKRMRMRRTQGQYPFVRFARRLLNYLCDRKGSARLSTAFLTTLVTNVHQQNDFKAALRRLSLLRDWTGTYRAKSAPACTA